MGLLYPGLKAFVLNGLERGLNAEDMYNKVTENYGYDKTFFAFKDYVYRVRIRYFIQKDKQFAVGENSDLVSLLIQNPNITIIELCDKLNYIPREIFKIIEEHKELGYEIIYDDIRVFLDKIHTDRKRFESPLNEKEIVFGVASDLHFGSKSCQITRLHEFCEECKKWGVKHILVPGDVLAGHEVYRGQTFELYAVGATSQVNSLIANLPKGNFEWYLMGGNHDYSYIKKGGYNPLRIICNKRNDCHYVGFNSVTIPILEQIDVRMWHPKGACAYSLSHKLQKGIENLALDQLRKLIDGESSSIIKMILSGHFHTSVFIDTGSIMGVQCGTFEGSTTYTETLGLVPSIGGWIFTIWFDGVNSTRIIPYFFKGKEIKDDYKNYCHNINGQTTIDQLPPLKWGS